jgi:hypothetical protein
MKQAFLELNMSAFSARSGKIAENLTRRRYVQESGAYLVLSEAARNSRKSGCASSGRLLNSGWN